MRYLAIALVVLHSATVLTAQAKSPAFEVASVKADEESMFRTAILPGGELRLVALTLSDIIRLAFGRTTDIVGIPEWAQGVRYTIDAKPPDGANPSASSVLAMLRALLRSRFAMESHTERRDVPIFNLVRDRSDRLGPRLRPSDTDCGGYILGLLETPDPTGGVPCAVTMPPPMPGLMTLRMKGRSMDQVVTDLRSVVDRPVRNLTNLPGRCDVVIDFSSDAAVLAGRARGLPLDGAMREQLGLRLEVATGVADVIVIDHIERPSEN